MLVHQKSTESFVIERLDILATAVERDESSWMLTITSQDEENDEDYENQGPIINVPSGPSGSNQQAIH